MGTRWIEALLDDRVLEGPAVTPPSAAGEADPDPGRVRTLLTLNALPSQCAHPARMEAWAGCPPGGWRQLLAALQMLDPEAVPGEAAARLHRHVSQAWQADPEWALPWIEDLADPALPLLLASPAEFIRLQQRAGWLLLGPALRQVIARVDRVQLHDDLGPVGLNFVHRTALRYWPGGSQAPRLSARPLGEQVQVWGTALLGRAMEAGSEPVRRRAQLRLPPAWTACASQLPGSLTAPRAALAVCLRLLANAEGASDAEPTDQAVMAADFNAALP